MLYMTDYETIHLQLKIQRECVISNLCGDNSVLHFTCILKLMFGMMVLTHFLLLGFNELTLKVWVNKEYTLTLAHICLIVLKHACHY